MITKQYESRQFQESAERGGFSTERRVELAYEISALTKGIFGREAKILPLKPEEVLAKQDGRIIVDQDERFVSSSLASPPVQPRMPGAHKVTEVGSVMTPAPEDQGHGFARQTVRELSEDMLQGSDLAPQAPTLSEAKEIISGQLELHGVLYAAREAQDTIAFANDESKKKFVDNGYEEIQPANLELVPRPFIEACADCPMSQVVGNVACCDTIMMRFSDEPVETINVRPPEVEADVYQFPGTYQEDDQYSLAVG